jgi:hypothetical protein
MPLLIFLGVNMSSKTEMAQIVGMIGSAYPNFNGAKETVAVYYELLNDLPLDLVRAATLQCCAEAGRKFAPSVGEIRGMAGELYRKAQGVPTALEAWDETCKAPKRGELIRATDEVDENGNSFIERTKFVWSHPLVEKVARMLGFPNFPNLENLSTDRAHFFKQYELELSKYKGEAVELPEVTRYIEANSMSALKQLEKGMAK